MSFYLLDYLLILIISYKQSVHDLCKIQWLIYLKFFISVAFIHFIL